MLQVCIAFNPLQHFPHLPNRYFPGAVTLWPLRIVNVPLFTTSPTLHLVTDSPGLTVVGGHSDAAHVIIHGIPYTMNSPVAT